MVGHQAIGIDYNLEQVGEADKLFHEQHIVGIGREDAIPAVATVYDMIDCARKFNPQWPGHNNSYAVFRNLSDN